MGRIDKRDDVSPKGGAREYGEVEFADPTNKKYPIVSSADINRPAGPLSAARKRSVSRAAWAALVVGVFVLIFMLIFILQNNVATQFTFLAWTFSIPLGVAMLFAAIGGALITAMVGTVRMIVLGRNVRQLEQERATPA